MLCLGTSEGRSNSDWPEVRCRISGALMTKTNQAILCGVAAIVLAYAACRRESSQDTSVRVKQEPSAGVKPDLNAGVSVSVCTPDGHFHNIASDPARLGSTGDRHHNVLLTQSQMSELIHFVRKTRSLPWQDMTAESPYPKAHTVLLFRGPAPSGEGHLMCSIGPAQSAVPILKGLLRRLPEASRQDLQGSVDRMESK